MPKLSVLHSLYKGLAEHYFTHTTGYGQSTISLTLQKQICSKSTVQRLPPELHNSFWTGAAKIKSHTVANVDRATLIVPMLQELYYTFSVGTYCQRFSPELNYIEDIAVGRGVCFTLTVPVSPELS
jgi:hypothetical protein